MSTTVTAKRNGTFVIELSNPIGENGAVTEIAIRPASFDIADRWAKDHIQSTLGLLSVLSGISEKVLVTLEYPDVDRVLSIFAIALPQGIRAAIENGSKPLTTPKIAPAPVNDEAARPADTGDPRFPQADGPVRRYAGTPPDHDDTSGFSTSPDRKV